MLGQMTTDNATISEGGAWAEVDPDTAGAEAEAEIWPEPGPEWDLAYEEWQEAWPVHVYLFALAFLFVSVLAIYIALSVCLTHHAAKRRSRSAVSDSRASGGGGGDSKGGGGGEVNGGSKVNMNCTTVALMMMIVSFSFSRCLFLFVDPYFSVEVVPFVFARLLWSLGIPGFTASFSIVLLILLDTTRLSLGPPKFQKVSTVAVIWLLHMAVVLVTDLLVIYINSDVRPMLILCQVLFVLYGAAVSVGFAYVGVKMRGNLKASSNALPGDEHSKKLRRLVLITFLSSVVALSVAVLNVYTALSEFGPYSGVHYVHPWPFWTMQTVSRFLELAACCLVLMLFFRSDKVRSWSWLGDRCLGLYRRHRDFSVHPKHPVKIGTITITTSSPVPAITGVVWRQIKSENGTTEA